MGCANASCKSCQTCNTCQGCNICQDCDSCQTQCDLVQSFCDMSAGETKTHNNGVANQSASHYLDDFNWKGCSATGQTIFQTWTTKEWTRLQTWIKDAYEYGNVHSTAPTMESATTSDLLITAKKYNDIVNALRNLGATSPTTVQGRTAEYAGDIIRSYHATNIVKGTNQEAKIPKKNCDICNINCDSGCDDCNSVCDSCNASCLTCNAACQGCQTCVSCQGQQHYSTCYGSCYTPPPPSTEG